MGGRQEPPDVAWLVPELDDGVEDPLLRPELEELEFDDPELADPEPTGVDPELSVPDDDRLADDPDDVEACEDDVPLLCEPGRVKVMTPAVATLASPTAAVAVWIRLRPRARAATARRMLSRLRVFMPCSLLRASWGLLCTSSQPPMSLDATGLCSVAYTPARAAEIGGGPARGYGSCP
jgi:hypothetical protein